MSKRKVTQYTTEFKQSSAKLAATSDQPISQTAQDLGVHVTTLHGWVKKFYPNATVNKPSESDLTEEVKILRKKVARLTQERDILKKATAYFANEIP